MYRQWWSTDLRVCLSVHLSERVMLCAASPSCSRSRHLMLILLTDCQGITEETFQFDLNYRDKRIICIVIPQRDKLKRILENPDIFYASCAVHGCYSQGHQTNHSATFDCHSQPWKYTGPYLDKGHWCWYFIWYRGSSFGPLLCLSSSVSLSALKLSVKSLTHTLNAVLAENSSACGVDLNMRLLTKPGLRVLGNTNQHSQLLGQHIYQILLTQIITQFDTVA